MIDLKNMAGGEDQAQQPTSSATTTTTTGNVNHLKFKPRQFRYQDDFSQFIARFKNYVKICKIVDPDLYLIFLSLLDDRTYSKLHNIELEVADRADAEKFCKNL